MVQPLHLHFDRLSTIHAIHIYEAKTQYIKLEKKHSGSTDLSQAGHIVSRTRNIFVYTVYRQL